MAEQESVWAYPRPPRLEPSRELVRMEHGGVVLAESQGALRVLETSHPPVYYIPPEDVATDYLEASSRARSFCEFKGLAVYWTVHMPAGHLSRDAAWSYPEPTGAYKALRGYLAFYASRVDACFVSGERVTAQPGDFYGGWITSRVKGPFKGSPGTLGW